MIEYNTPITIKNHKNANLFDNIQNQGYYLPNIGCIQWNVSIFTVRNYSTIIPLLRD